MGELVATWSELLIFADDFECNGDVSQVVALSTHYTRFVMPIMRLLFAVLWLVVGAYCLYTPKSVRSYLGGLSDSPGSRQIKQRRYYLRIAGTVAIGIGLWHLFRFFR